MSFFQDVKAGRRKYHTLKRNDPEFSAYFAATSSFEILLILMLTFIVIFDFSVTVSLGLALLLAVARFGYEIMPYFRLKRNSK